MLGASPWGRIPGACLEGYWRSPFASPRSLLLKHLPYFLTCQQSPSGRNLPQVASTGAVHTGSHQTVTDHLGRCGPSSRRSFLVSFYPGFLTAPPNNSKPAATCHPQAFCQVFKVDVLSLRTGVRAQKQEPVRVEKDANEETQKAQPRLQGWGGGNRWETQGHSLWGSDLEERRAENSRARRPSYETATWQSQQLSQCQDFSWGW